MSWARGRRTRRRYPRSSITSLRPGPPLRKAGDDTHDVNLPAWGAFALAAVASAGDLVSILRHLKRLENATKPAVMVLLIAAAVLLHPASQGERALFIAALVLGLAGDVFLMLPDHYLIPGIAAFLAGHLAYAAGFRFGGFAIFGLVAGLVIVSATAGPFRRHPITARA